jgi:hypothetical protein
MQMPRAPLNDPIEQMKRGRFNGGFLYHNRLLDVSDSQEEM